MSHRKVFETAGLVLGVFPDLELAICEGEQALAQSFFSTIKGWLSEIRKEIQDIQRVRHSTALSRPTASDERGGLTAMVWMPVCCCSRTRRRRPRCLG